MYRYTCMYIGTQLLYICMLMRTMVKYNLLLKRDRTDQLYLAPTKQLYITIVRINIRIYSGCVYKKYVCLYIHLSYIWKQWYNLI